MSQILTKIYVFFAKCLRSKHKILSDDFVFDWFVNFYYIYSCHSFYFCDSDYFFILLDLYFFYQSLTVQSWKFLISNHFLFICIFLSIKISILAIGIGFWLKVRINYKIKICFNRNMYVKNNDFYKKIINNKMSKCKNKYLYTIFYFKHTLPLVYLLCFTSQKFLQFFFFLKRNF